ncbi:hypothetical protein SARC_12348 [Sphaeroforma arctica JP610]|uniref:Uncharacterized protein n=1 Tax=Sphaeroforma arctica JP610 TaxID=667725 RepID=A0A0L0FEF7_9EUKA|nr:hypothetical protein SARC_12348 [Sphaeroforma arctica JP610]KNC75120.1 hypothetical protein SARC_12348 [Sphaeroforma arctica JP610]|eukprot:XP_014149022.1 hypothetical protein SARC_12348 [Sphaeroforma arctica JP610]
MIKLGLTKTAPEVHDEWSMRREKAQMPAADGSTMEHYYSTQVGKKTDGFLTRMLAKGMETPEENRIKQEARLKQQVALADANLDIWNRPSYSGIQIVDRVRPHNWRGLGIGDKD